MVAALANWRKQTEKRSGFQKSLLGLFKEHGVIERCEDEYMLHLAIEFSWFKNLMVLWAMHPWERDAGLAHHVLHQAYPSAIAVEIACARSADELLSARKAFMALLHHSLKEDVAYRAKDNPYCSVSSSFFLWTDNRWRFFFGAMAMEASSLLARALSRGRISLSGP